MLYEYAVVGGVHPLLWVHDLGDASSCEDDVAQADADAIAPNGVRWWHAGPGATAAIR